MVLELTYLDSVFLTTAATSDTGMYDSFPCLEPQICTQHRMSHSPDLHTTSDES